MKDIFDTDYTKKELINELSNSFNEPSWLLERRLSAYDQYKSLPYDQDTLFYKYTTFKKFDPSTLTRINKEEEVPFEYESKLSTPPTILLKDESISFNISEDLKQSGVIIDTLHNLIKSDEELARKIIKDVEFSAGFDKLGSLASAFATTILVLYVPKGVVVDELIIIQNELSDSNIAKFVEFIGVFERDSKISFLEVFENSNSKSTNSKLYSSMQSFRVFDNASISFGQIQAWDHKMVHMDARIIQLENYARARGITHLQGSDMTRHNSKVHLKGNGSEGYDLYLKFGNETQRFDIKTEIYHEGRDTIGQAHARTVMMDRAESILRGLMTIPEPAVNADSWLTSQGLTIDKGKVIAIPALQIDQNDIKAAHAASVEPLKDELLFYLESRGIPKNESREMLIKGYFEYVIQLIKNDKIAENVRQILSKKWNVLS